MIARNRIWFELKQARSNIVCLQRYTDKGRKILRIYNSWIIFFASAGTVGGIYGELAPIIGTSVIAISTICKAISKNIIQSEQELDDLDRLLDFYSKYMNKLEKLWYKYNTGNIIEDKMIHKLLKMKDNECGKYSILNRSIRHLSKKEKDKIEKECDDYINEIYFYKTNEDEKE